MRLDPAVAATRTAVRRVVAGLGRDELALVAASGGADSMALAAAAAFVCRRAGPRVGLVTVDHGLQPGSGERAAALVAWAGAAGMAPAEAVRVDVRPSGRGPEAAAREARYAALEAAAHRHGAAVVLLGHTLDDQAETVLLRLARGSGARALAGMPAARGCYRRPFLGLGRSVTAAACRAQRIEVWADPHNENPAFTRARVRRTLLPALVEVLGPAAVAGLARSAALLRDDADALDARAGEVLAGPGALDVAALAGLPRAVRTRVLRAAAVAAGAPGGAVSAEHVAGLERLVTGWRGQGPVFLPGGLLGERACGRLRFYARAAERPAP